MTIDVDMIKTAATKMNTAQSPAFKEMHIMSENSSKLSSQLDKKQNLKSVEKDYQIPNDA